MKKKWSIFNIGLQKRTGFTIDPIFKRASELNMGWVNCPASYAQSIIPDSYHDIWVGDKWDERTKTWNYDAQ
jgi:hypothetical protein